MSQRSGNAPHVDVFADENLELTTFYWPDATRQSAEDALRGQPLGSFLVRPSSMPNCKALTHVVQDGKVGHALIVKQDGIVTLEATDREFTSVEHLVGMLSLQPVSLSQTQKEQLDQRRRDFAQRKAAEQERAQRVFQQAHNEQEEENRRMVEERRRAATARRTNQRQMEESKRRALDEKRRRVQSVPDREQRQRARKQQYSQQHRFTPHELNTIEEVFADLDRGNAGGFDAHDVQDILEEMGSEFTQVDINNFLREIDRDGNGIVLFDEFLDCVDKLGDDLEVPPPIQASDDLLPSNGRMTPR